MIGEGVLRVGRVGEILELMIANAVAEGSDGVESLNLGTARYFDIAATREEDGIVGNGEHLLLDEHKAGIVGELRECGGGIGEVVIVTVEAEGNGHTAATGEGDGASCDGECLRLTREVAGIVGKMAVAGRAVVEAVVVAVEAVEHHEAATSEEDGVVGDGEHLFLAEGDTTETVGDVDIEGVGDANKLIGGGQLYTIGMRDIDLHRVETVAPIDIAGPHDGREGTETVCGDGLLLGVENAACSCTTKDVNMKIKVAIRNQFPLCVAHHSLQ